MNDLAMVTLCAALARLLKQHLAEMDDPKERAVASAAAMGVAIDMHQRTLKDAGYSEAMALATGTRTMARAIDYASAGDLVDGAIEMARELGGDDGAAG